MDNFDWATNPHGFLKVGDIQLECASFGPAPDQAPAIILLHDALGCLSLWRDFPQKLSDATGFGVFAYSRQGYGQSQAITLPRPLDFMTHEALGPLAALLDLIGFQRGILMGHSDGATISAIYAGSVADHRIRGLILMAPHFFTEPMGLAQIAQARTEFETTDLKDRLAKHHNDPEGAFLGWNDVWLDPGFAAWNVGDVIDYFRIPTLAIQGRDDPYGTLAQIEEVETRSYAPVDMVVIDDCKHAPHQEHPEVVLNAIADFTQRLERIEAEVVVPA